MPAKPEPRVTSEVCSLCGLDWKRHGKAPTADKCIELLLAEVRSLNAQLATRPYGVPWPVAVPYPQPYPVPYRPWYQPYTTWGTALTANTGSTPAMATSTPRAITQTASC